MSEPSAAAVRATVERGTNLPTGREWEKWARDVANIACDFGTADLLLAALRQREALTATRERSA